MPEIITNPCPICGNDKLALKKEVIKKYAKSEDNIKVWAYCLNCGHRGLSAFGRFTDEEAVAAAYKMWNEG